MELANVVADNFVVKVLDGIVRIQAQEQLPQVLILKKV